MKTKLIAAMFLMVSCFFSIPVLGAGMTAEMAGLENGGAAWGLMELNGFDKEIAQLKPAFAQVADKLRNDRDIPYRRRRVASRVIEGMFETKRLTRAVHRNLAGMWEPAKMAPVLNFLRSPLGRRITEMELNSEETGQARWLSDWERNRPTDKRIALVLALDLAAGVSKVAVEIWTLVTLVTIISSDDPDVLNTGMEVRKLGRMRQAIREKIAASVHNSVVLGLLYTYRRAKDADLEAYVEFFRGDAGRSYARMTKNAFLGALIDMASKAHKQARVQVAL